MRNRLVLPGKADTRYLRTHFPNLDSRTFSRGVGECPYSTHPDTCCRLWAPMEMLQWLGSSGDLQGWDCGIHICHWKVWWDYHRQPYSVSMDLEERFHPTPISHYFPLLVPKLLYSSCSSTDCSKHREGCGGKRNHFLCHWDSLVYTGNEPL